MRFGKLIVLGTLLAAFSPLAFADTLIGTIVVDGAGFGAAVNAGNLNFNTIGGTGPIKRESAGLVDSGTASFAIYTAGNPVNYFAGAPAANALLTFSDVAAVNSTPILFMETLESGKTLDFYVTYVNPSSIQQGTANKKGAFSGLGFVTDDGNLTETAVSFNFLSTAVGAGKGNFALAITAPAPEPASLALLGTGMLGLTGIIRRKLRAA